MRLKFVIDDQTTSAPYTIGNIPDYSPTAGQRKFADYNNYVITPSSYFKVTSNIVGAAPCVYMYAT